MRRDTERENAGWVSNMIGEDSEGKHKAEKREEMREEGRERGSKICCS